MISRRREDKGNRKLPSRFKQRSETQPNVGFREISLATFRVENHSEGHRVLEKYFLSGQNEGKSVNKLPHSSKNELTMAKIKVLC